MTRLVEDWIKDISSVIKDYEKDLIKKTGLDYIGLASAASGVSKIKIIQASKNKEVGVVPVTTGLGLIGSFSESVAAIAQCMGFEAFVTEHTDVAGIYEAQQKGAKIIFIADDDKFIALNIEKNMAAENSRSTARGYVAALEGAAQDVKDKEVLVIGCGVVGKEVLAALKEKGANPVAWDIKQEVLKELSDGGLKVLKCQEEIAGYSLIVDATYQGGWISKDMLHPEVFMVTPGVPISLDEEAYDCHRNRVLHDYLPIGVAVMLAETCK